MSYKSVKDKNNQCRLHVSNTSQFDNNLSFVGVRGNLSNVSLVKCSALGYIPWSQAGMGSIT